jgi:hypothetical protein
VYGGLLLRRRAERRWLARDPLVRAKTSKFWLAFTPSQRRDRP